MKKYIYKKINLLLIVIATLLCFPLNANAANFTDSSRLLGDATNDKSIDIFDILQIQRHILGINVLTGDDFIAADVTSDNAVDIFDILSIQRYILGDTTHFHSYTATVIQKRSCTDNEITQYTCSCGDTYQVVTAYATGHTAGPAQIDENGNYVIKCTVCGSTMELIEKYTGWFESNGSKYYYDSGVKYTGWNSINNREYYFSNEGVLQSKSGIDVSSHQGTIDWDAVKADGIEFAIIRVGFGSDEGDQDDKQAINNMLGCERVGLPYAVYLYSYALEDHQVLSEASHVLRMIDGHKPQLGVWFDMEDADGYKERNGMNVFESRQLLTDFCKTFCNIINATGNKAGIYANMNYFSNVLYLDQLLDYDKWLAIWGPSKCPDGDWKVWQYTSDGTVSGIGGRVDMDVLIN